MDERPRAEDLPFPVPDNLDPDCFLFLGDPTRETRSLLGRYWLAGSFAFMFGGASLLGNLLLRRPLRAGIHKHILSGVGGLVFGELGYRYKEKYLSEKDLQYFHYMTLHPDDFRAPKKVLYRDYLAPWYPVR